MSSRYKSPLNLNNNSFSNIRERLAILLNTTLPSTFNCIIIASLIATIDKEDTLLLIIRLRNTC
jgi:hypothetical protein